MSYQLDVKKLIADIKGPKGLSAVSSEIEKISGEIQRLQAVYRPQAEAKYNEVIKYINKLETQIEKEVKAKLANLQKQAKAALAKSKKASKPAAKTTKKAAPAKTTKKKTTRKKANA